MYLHQTSCGPTQTAYPPQNLTANPVGDKHVFLTWSNGTKHNVEIVYYVSYKDINGTIYDVGNTTSLVMNVIGLSPNTNYTMTVRADKGIAGNEVNRSVITKGEGMLSGHCD